jgi:hypothetical protein
VVAGSDAERQEPVGEGIGAGCKRGCSERSTRRFAQTSIT